MADLDKVTLDIPEDGEVASRPESSVEKKPETGPMVSFSQLFRFYDKGEMAMLAVGLFFCAVAGIAFPCINIAFGELLDSTASLSNVEETTKRAVLFMIGVASILGASLFTGMGLVAWAATRGANNIRRAYVKAMMAQDVRFFDDAKAGELSAATAEKVNEVQNGTAKKLGELVQALFTGVGGIGVGFYFSWQLSLVILAGTPLLAFATLMLIKATTLLTQANPAYEKAGAIATESIGAIRVTSALNAQGSAAARYEANLGEAERHATKNQWRIAFAGGGLFGSMFFMYAFGLWFGAYLIATSTDKAMKDHPAPAGLIDPFDETWGAHANQSAALCFDTKTGDAYTGDALLTCACSLDYAILPTATMLTNPNCGCGYRTGALAGTGLSAGSSPCITGGTVIMVFFSVLFGGFMFGQAGASIEAVVKARIAAHKLYAVIDRAPRGGKGADTRAHEGQALVPADVRGDIMFERVHFSYGVRPIFRGIDLWIPAGTTAALVGESGCGKSTVTRLLERFYDPSSGTITIDGVDISSIRITDLRAAIGVVSQEPLLFEASIRENVAIGRANVAAADVPLEDVMTAAQAAMAHDFISLFPDGYETVVGGKNSKLSGGQKQRIAIARAALRNPPILILDEATSALDTENERLVQQALDSLVAGTRRTTIVIAHRLTTVRGAEKIIVLGAKDAAGGMAGGGSAEGSVVIEEGTHDELMRRPDGRYRALVGLGGASKSASASTASLSAMGDRTASKMNIEAIAKAAAGVADGDEKKLSEEGKESETKPPKVNSKRIWAYSEPEYKLLAFGAVVALVNGCIFPSIAFVFAEMLSLFYSADTDYIMQYGYVFAGIFIGISAAAWIIGGTQGGVFAIIGERLTTRLRVHLFRAILRQEVSYFDDPKNSVGALTANLRTDTALVQSATGKSFGSAVQTFGSLIFGLTLAMTASWKYGLVLLAAVPILSVGEMINMQNLASGDSIVSESMGRCAALVSESATMIREVKAFGLENRMYDAYDALLKVPHREERNKALSGAAAFGVAQGMTMMFYAFAFWWGSHLIAKGELDFYDFMKSLWALGFCAAGAGQGAAFAGDANAAQGAASRIFALIDRKPPIDAKPFVDGTPGLVEKGLEIRPVPRTVADANRAGQGTVVEDFKGVIEFKGVKFSYPQRESAVLGGVDLVVRPGETVALIGQSGSGKSTAVQLIERFYDPVAHSPTDVSKDGSLSKICVDGRDPDAGAVTVDGVDLRDVDPKWLRANIGVVEQEPTLFSGTVHENIAQGKGGEPATREEVIEAAKIANAHDFISKMEKGYDSEVGVGGGLVSGGQKQRIAIARAIIGKPRILLLDEATSALDNESEKLVQKALDGLLMDGDASKRTTIVIAHRLSTIRNATRICILDNADGTGAKVVEQGTHDELMKIPGGRYGALRAAYDDSTNDD